MQTVWSKNCTVCCVESCRSGSCQRIKRQNHQVVEVIFVNVKTNVVSLAMDKKYKWV